MRRPLIIAALVAAVTALVASTAMAFGTLGRPSSGVSIMGGSGQGQGPGMMGGQGQGGMMGGSMGSMGMADSMGMTWLPADEVAVSDIPAARARAATAAAPAGLHSGEVMWFDNGFYVEFKDRAGEPATEVIVDPRIGAVRTESGPAMMWNTG